MDRRRRFHDAFAPVTLALLVGLIGAAPASAASPYDQGEMVEIQGVVTDANGVPQAGRTVVLEVYRRAFDLRSLNLRDRGMGRRGLVQRTAMTDDQGRYLFRWPWHDYYNRFEVSVGSFGEEGFEVVERADISQRILRGSPVTVSFILGARVAPATTAPPPVRVETPTASLAPGGSADQRRLLEREGEPDHIDALELPYGREVTWWYFADGRAYRFLDGEMTDQLTFDPVRSY